MTPTFKQPLFDDSLLLPQWLQYNARHSPDHPLFLYSLKEENIITWSKAGKGFLRAAQLVESHLEPGVQGGTPPVIGILANLDAITYHTLYLGIITAGATAFLISTRNSPAAVSHLLNKTGTHSLFVSTDEPVQNLASAALASLHRDGHKVDLHPVPNFQDLYSEGVDHGDTEDLPNYLVDRTIDSPALILHSSGSTAFPKPITISHRIVLKWAKHTRIAGVELNKHRLAAHALPVFHAMGFCLAPWAAYTGLTLTVFPPRVPPVVPSPANVLEAALTSRSSFLVCVPLFIELWSGSADDVSKLKQFDGIIFGGGPLSTAIGNELVREGVSLLSRYGATEVGPGGTLMVPKKLGDPEWDWLHLSPDIKATFLQQEGESDVFELVFLASPTYSPALLNSEVDGIGAFATNDLVIRHPTDPAKFKIHGRKDDQIMLSTGEKTNPGPLEVIICRNPLIQAAVMFGRGRVQNGVIIKPKKEHEIDPTDAVALAQFRTEIWPSVEQANGFAPTHSKIYKEMILVTQPSKPFELTAKHTPRRPIVLETYKNEINAAYDAVEASSQTGIPLPSVWLSGETLDFVRKIVHKVTGKELADDVDLFEQGSDSLQATYIRNSLVYAVRETNRDTRRISQGFVYANPSITSLSTQLLAIVEASSGVGGNENLAKLKEMEDLITEFSADFPVHKSSLPLKSPMGEVVLLTGSTGGLGSQLLWHLVSLSTVSHVYAINRPASGGHKSLRERQSEALSERGLDAGILDSAKVTLVEGDTATPSFGINATLFNQIRDSITLIIHNAWRVNFNLTLRSFRPMIRGVRNLIDLALQSPQRAPPRIIFTGSVGVFRNWSVQAGRPLEASIKDPAVVIGNGYTESKFVGERLLEHAAKSTPLRPIMVRIGQVTSNSSGAWNSGDWLPAIVRSGQVIGVLPSRDDVIAWIPLDTAARALVDFRNSDSQYLHLAHPNPVPWKAVFDRFSLLLKVPLVSWTEWLSKLEKEGGRPENNPAVHLIDFFQGCTLSGGPDTEALGMPLLDLTQALKSSPTLADHGLPLVGREDAERWVNYWRKNKGFLDP